MTKEDPIGQALAIVDVSLREFFPGDFYKRCMYASLGIAALLRDEGVSAHVVGGEFICTVVSRDGATMTLQGFGGSKDGLPSHFWVLAAGQQLDLGPMYLSYEASFPAAPLPILRWPTAVKLPNFILYREHARYAGDVELLDPVIREKNIAFLSHCRSVRDSASSRFPVPTWQLKDSQSLHFAARRGDMWSRASVEFLRRSMKAAFPTQ